MKDLPPPLYIDTEQQLTEWVEHCARAKVLAVDTESDSFHHYREKVCLVQMTALGRDAIIDPLALPNLEPLRALFDDSSKTKIFHDAVYDLICLRRDYNLRIVGLFDTMVASRMLGKRNFGLAAILRERYGFEADKRLQRSDWARRPLSDQQLAYARFDTHFLPQLMDVLAGELQDVKRWGWAEEEFSRLPDVSSRITPRVAGADPDGFWRVKGIRNMSPDVLGRVQALYLARERIAERLDRPAFKVFGDQVIIELALDPPDEGDLRPRPGLRRPGLDRFGKEIGNALASARPVHGKAPQGATRRRRSGRFLDPDARKRYEDLRALRRAIADDLGLEPEVALGNAVLEELARKSHVELGEIQGHVDFQGWRAEFFVTQIHDLLSGRLDVRSLPAPRDEIHIGRRH